MRRKYCFIIAIDAETRERRVATVQRKEANEMGVTIYETPKEAFIALMEGETGAIQATE